MEGIARLDLADEAGVARLDIDDGPAVLVAVEVDVLDLAHEPAEEPGEFGEPLDLFHARGGCGFFLGELVSFPGLEVLIRLPDEEDLAQLGVEGIRGQDEDAFLLLHSAEVEEVGAGRGSPRRGPEGSGRGAFRKLNRRERRDESEQVR